MKDHPIEKPMRLILLGAADGPWCSVGNIKDPVLRIRGLVSGTITLVAKNDETESWMSFSENGDYDLPGKQDWLRAICTCKSIVCIVLPRRKAA